MIRTVRYRVPIAAAALAGLFAILTSGCGVPLAPGYKIQKETLAVHFVPGSPPHLAVRAEYRLANIGNAPLKIIQFKVLPKELIGRENLRVVVDGQIVSSPALMRYDDSFDAISIPFSPAWKQKQRVELSITYDSTNGNAGILASDGFFHTGVTLFPVPVAPKSFLASKPVRPDPTNVFVTVPSDFLVLCNGKSEGGKGGGNEIVHRFQIHKKDPDLSIVAGHYKQHEVQTSDGKIILWTFQELSLNDAATAAPQIAAIFGFLDTNFGFRDRKSVPVWVAAIPSPDVLTQNDTVEPMFLYFRGGILVSGTEIGKSLASPEVLEGIQNTLINGLFNEVIEPRGDATFLLNGLENYANEAIRQNSDGLKVRTETILKLLQEYDGFKRQAVEKPVLQVSSDDSLAVSTMALDKSLLLPFALEDKCGQQNLTHAISDMVYALRGEEYGYSDFRAALEQQCHQDLDGFFRQWLTQPGIPPDFRARYENAGGSKP